MVRLLSSYLTNRNLRGISAKCFKKIQIKAGTPQGRALSPLLFIFYVNDTLKTPNWGLPSKDKKPQETTKTQVCLFNSSKPDIKHYLGP